MKSESSTWCKPENLSCSSVGGKVKYDRMKAALYFVPFVPALHAQQVPMFSVGSASSIVYPILPAKHYFLLVGL